jgi:ketosteroid isomerase-like protein
MIYKFIPSLVCVVFIIFSSPYTQKTAEEKDAAERNKIENTISSCIGWFKDKDFDLLFSVIAHDSHYVSVHPTNRVIKGFDEFKKSSEVFKDPDFKYVKHELRDLSIRLSKSRDVAWFYCILNDMNTWKGQPANWENTRWTGVLEKRDGRWVIVQQHFSFAAP